MVNRTGALPLFASHDSDHDGGLEHNHNWARERSATVRGLSVADASAARTPSSVTHDDAIYGF